ncbi:MAG: glycosyltransferase family 4 protein [Candidatus Saganbacteria bacterium]|nr:glycosyltransferase family 4 protein [Candidatus Saganbacteria bacterium]
MDRAKDVKTKLLEKSRKMKLLILSQIFYPEMISTGQNLTELAEELVKMGVDVKALCGPVTIIKETVKIPSRIEYKGIKIRRVWGTRFPKLHILGRILNQLTFALSVFVTLLLDRSKRPILVVTNPPFLPYFCALLRSFRIGNAYLFLVHDVYPETAIGLGLMKQNSLLVRLWNYMNAQVLKYASMIVVIGRCMQNIIEGKAQKAEVAIKGKVKLIPIWSDDRIIKPLPKEGNIFIEKWGLKGKFIVLYSGNMGWFHDMETIMEAASVLKDRREIAFVFVGEGKKKKWMQQFVAEKKLSNCQFYGYVDKKDLPILLTAADVGLASLLEGQEGLSVPSKTLGLMAAGVPVIAIVPKTSEIAQIVSEEGCGKTVFPGDIDGLVQTIEWGYENKLALALMGEKGRKAVDNKYNLQTAAKAFYNLIVHLSD